MAAKEEISGVNKKLRVLVAKYSEDDARLLIRELNRGGYDPVFERVETKQGFRNALAELRWDLVISDYSMPDLDAVSALRSMHEGGLDVPFIIVSGTATNEIVVKAMKTGAHDFITMDNLSRLVPAVERELRDAEARRERRRMEFELEQYHAGLRKSIEERTAELKAANEKLLNEISGRRHAEETFRRVSRRNELILKSAGEGIFGVDTDGNHTFINKAAAAMLGYGPDELLGGNSHATYHHTKPDGSPYPQEECPIYAAYRDGAEHSGQDMFWKKNGTSFAIDFTSRPIYEEDRIVGAVVTFNDITKRKLADEALRDSESTLRGIASAALDAVILIDEDGNVSFWNDAAAKMFGYMKEEVEGKNMHSFIVPERYVDSFRKGFETFRVTGDGLFIGKVYEIDAKRKDGTEFPVELSLAALKLKGKWNALGIVRDISERKLTEEALRAAQEKSELERAQLEAVVTQMTEGLVVFDPEGNLINMNPAALEIHGYDNVQTVRRHLNELRENFELFDLNGRVLPAARWPIDRVMNGETFDSYEVRVRRRDTGKSWIASYGGTQVRDEKGRGLLSIVTLRDITERKRMEEEMRHLAHHDALTGLPNRRLFRDICELEIFQALRNRTKAAILFLDLDRFKEINDTLGHGVGDELLKQAAVRFKQSIRKSDTVARIGGDEFNIILADIARPEDISDIARKINDRFRSPFFIGGHELKVTTSIGISVFADDGEDIDGLLRYADIAMYHAKESGRNTYKFYNPEINVLSLERMKLEGHLRRTIERAELRLLYQPQVDIRAGKIICAEALVRWEHPEKGLLEPGEFMPLAEQTGLITSIDEWVLNSACSQLKTWREAGLSPVCITVNLSSRQFKRPELADTIVSILGKTGTDPDCLNVEISESTAMSDIEQTAYRLEELRRIGVHISIDDFGTGCSSLNYLQRLPIERLKIDRSLIRDIATDPDGRTIVHAMTEMAHTMKMKVLAEGVENEDQLSFLRKTGCDEAQGFLFSRPLPSEEFRELITAAR